ncbi:hypothetical protein HOD19_02800 [bacterium]|jgi:hypothetical protein|nr:hypothetical protein [bacterium]
MKYFVSILLLAMFFGTIAISSAQASAQQSSWSQVKSIYGGEGGKSDG